MINEPITIKEYDPSYAKSIAEMWNNSAEGWNGRNNHQTEDSVKEKEALSSHLNLYLALIGDKVVGYCKLSKYEYDENTLYIDLLNVDPQYFNHKIGKALVRLSVERTIELGYPRLDLFTWAGNTKAVPLYKKCGFFWEKMEDNSTHLMNFIPTVLKTELLQDSFEYFDWYLDSTRPIVVEADGRTEQNFDFLTYEWEKAGKKLRVEFEKSSRGIHNIETDDYSITTEIANGKLIFGMKHIVRYHVTNKTGVALTVSLIGIDNKNIRFDMNYQAEIFGSHTVEGEFYLDPIEIEQSAWKTHPAVCAKISINGKSALLKTGINPQFPLKMLAGQKESRLIANREKQIYVNVENNFDEDCVFELTFPPQTDIRFAEKTVNIALKAHERNHFPIQIAVSNSVLYHQMIGVQASFASGQQLSYSQPITMTNLIPEGRTWGQNHQRTTVINGKSFFYMSKEQDHNEITLGNLNNKGYCTLGYPKLGKPYSSEFIHKSPDRVEFQETADALTLKVQYSSDAFPGCKFISHNKLYNSGMLEQYYELLTWPEGMEELILSHPIYIENRRGTIPYAGKHIIIDDIAYNNGDISNWDSDKLDENWLHFTNDTGNVSLVWDRMDRLICCDWNYAIEHTFRKGETWLSKPLFVAFDVFATVKDLREFALGTEVEYQNPKPCVNMQINSGNPFVEGKYQIDYQDYRRNPLDCTVRVNSVSSIYPTQSATAVSEQNLNHISFDIEAKSKAALEIINLQAIYPAKSFQIEKLLFNKQTSEVLESIEMLGENSIYTVNNGIICFKASPQYAPIVYSLMYDGHEWLDNSFPQPCSKSWWNPWCGGTESIPLNMKRSSWLLEKHLFAFVEKQDNFGQIWKGIEIKTKIENYDSLKNVTMCQYFLTLPGLPVLAMYSTYAQENGFYQKFDVYSRIFAKADEDIKQSTFELTREGEVFATKCGVEDIEFEVKGKLITSHGEHRNEKLYFYNSQAPQIVDVGSDTHVTSLLFYNEVILHSGSNKAIPPKYLILSELNIPERTLIDLDNIRFD